LSNYFARTINFIVNKQDLTAERSVGLFNSNKELSKTLMWNFTLHEKSQLQNIFKINECHYGIIPDEEFSAQLYTKIGKPTEEKCLLLPIKCNNQTIMLIYADNGSEPPQRIDDDFFNFFVIQAGLIMENALYHNQLKKLKAD
jgi:hypothetical protein